MASQFVMYAFLGRSKGVFVPLRLLLVAIFTINRPYIAVLCSLLCYVSYVHWHALMETRVEGLVISVYITPCALLKQWLVLILFLSKLENRIKLNFQLQNFLVQICVVA